MLTYFRAENYKCLERVAFPLTPIHVLIGPNDSGKTSVQEAMRTYMRSVGSGMPVESTLPVLWKGKELLFHGAEEGTGVSLSAMGDLARAVRTDDIGSTYRILGCGFTFRFGLEQSCQVTKEWLELGPVSPGADAPKQHRYARDDSIEPNFTSPAWYNHKAVDAEKKLRLPRGFLGTADLYRLDPQMLALPAFPDLERKFRMDSDGFGLATLLDDIIGYDPQLFLQLRASFCEFFPQFRSVRVETAEAYARRKTPDGVHTFQYGPIGKEVFFTTRWGGSVRARQASEGALLFLAFLALVHLPPERRPKLILLEDVERGVYPKKLEELVMVLKKWVSGNTIAEVDTPQIVLSTHSPYVLTFFSPEEVTFLSRAKDGGVRARPLRDAPEIHERLSGGFFLGELWYNLSEEELFGDAGQ
jgi:hypothetical protein